MKRLLVGLLVALALTACQSTFTMQTISVVHKEATNDSI